MISNVHRIEILSQIEEDETRENRYQPRFNDMDHARILFSAKKTRIPKNLLVMYLASWALDNCPAIQDILNADEEEIIRVLNAA
ncbi:hypothetical protein CAI21_21620 [Alkalilimnicola ehrlichii]|uniref:Uncharacterized protein n=1 Tax=Alkalilimnicola ehrlichii TaxID=351052 RepID=A0A3E0WQC2_9GAMM|nr:hypothetical protein [Alkalilimnicola ehrlichii]RFA24425.1 hypothetical protein CAI21_21620 [Alkalilimnicola ehrlichii]RFA35162.1 hypothetical protein CAL65_13745 [Alkalilimnicola ehrlichii]